MIDLFTQSTLSGPIGVRALSALQWGPDGKLYAAGRFGDIAVLDIARTGPDSYAVTRSEIITAIRTMPNHDDDGSLAGPDDDGFAALGSDDVDSLAGNQRQVTGLVVGGTAAAPVVYVTSSDPRIREGNGGADTFSDTNSGILSRLTRAADGTWEKLDLVRGLPRAEGNHSTNGLALSDDGRTLHVAQGGNTNAGAPSAGFLGLTETPLSAAILAIDLAQIDAIAAAEGVKTYRVPGFAPQRHVYDLPTLDDPTRPNGPGGLDRPGSGTVGGDPFGGNDGRNMAKLVAGGPVGVYSPGYRNVYDVLVTADGRIWTYDNGSNSAWGGLPVDQFGRRYTGAPGQVATNLPSENGFGILTTVNQLHEVKEGFYAGHPNLIRAFGAEAGLLLSPGNGTAGARLLRPGELPVDFAQAVHATNPEEALYRPGGAGDGALDTDIGSVNGLAEYTASTRFADGNGGTFSLRGALLATNYGPDTLIVIDRDDTTGAVATTTRDGRTVARDRQTIDLGGGGPLGIDAIGDDGPFPGTVWITKINGSTIQVLTPNTGGTAPPDGDRDDDGLDDVADRFALDPSNGRDLVIAAGTTRVFGFESGAGEYPGTEGGIGFTGAMVNGRDAYADDGLIDRQNIIFGGAANTLSLKRVAPGDALAAANTQQDAVQFGITLDATARRVGITTTMSNWIIGEDGRTLPLGGQPSAGLFIGTGDQDTYVKLVVAGRVRPDGTPMARIEQLHESGGAVVQGSGAADPTNGRNMPGLLASPVAEDHASWVQLRIEIDRAEGMITPSWRFGTEAERHPLTGALPDEAAKPFVAGNGIAATGALLDAIEGRHLVQGQPSGLAVGVIATSRGGAPFTVNYADLVIASPGAGGPGAEDDSLSGTAGPDILDGRGGDDLLRGLAGPDTLDGGPGRDTLEGGAGADLLRGGEGDDLLRGGSGQDLLAGGAGADTLSGDAGADAFRFASAAEGGDMIEAYAGAEDRIEVSAAGFGGGLVAGMDPVAAGRYLAAAAGEAISAPGVGQFVYQPGARALWWDADGAGGAAPVLLATLPGVTGWSGSEIAVIA